MSLFSTGNDYSFLSFTPASSLTFGGITRLAADYNLSMSSLSGAGTYKVEAVIGGNAVASPATFTLR